jgi:hypothetical protein
MEVPPEPEPVELIAFVLEVFGFSVAVAKPVYEYG